MNRTTIAIHPNTKEATVCNLHTGFFGIGRDGYSFPDDETVYPENRIRVVNYIEETFQEVTTNEKQVHRFQKGHTFWKKSLEARKRNQERNRELAKERKLFEDKIIELLTNKHYKLKDGGYVLAIDRIIERAIDDLADGKLNPVILNMIMEKADGKLASKVNITGALSHGTATEEETQRLLALFPENRQHDQ